MTVLEPSYLSVFLWDYAKIIFTFTFGASAVFKDTARFAFGTIWEENAKQNNVFVISFNDI